MSIKLHFLNVGDGDCTIIDFPDCIRRKTEERFSSRVMMVDIHHHDDHEDFEHVLDYYKANFKNGAGGVRPIFRYVSTHPHKDHLTGFKALVEEVPIHNFWDIEHRFEPDQSDDDWASYQQDWEKYLELRKGSGPKVHYYTDKTTPCEFWNQDDIEILSPSKELFERVHTKEDGTARDAVEIGQQLNNLSYVLLIRVNEIRILLASDAEAKTWEYILKNYAHKIKDIDILKAAHHGRESGFHEEAVKLMNPKHIVFSISEDTDYEHGVSEKYQKAAPRSTVHKTYEGSFILECGFDEAGTITKLEPYPAIPTRARPLLSALR